MTIAMFTNNYLPHIGGVARSVVGFTRQYRTRRHRVVIVAPHTKPQVADPDLIIIPSIHLEAAQGMTIPLAIPGVATRAVDAAAPDIIHSHHPFLLGSTAVITAARRNAPLVFTHHTMYEHYTHYAPADSPQLKEFVKDLSTGYANLCDCVFAPTPTVAAIIRNRGVTSRIEIVPTGIDTAQYAAGDGVRLRRQYDIPAGAFVVGYVGRLAREKNLPFLLKSLIEFLASQPDAHALIVGDGPLHAGLVGKTKQASLEHRIHFTKALENQQLADAYAAMNLFAFTSVSETQGLVLLEAAAAGIPVVALDAPGARDIIVPQRTGWLVKKQQQAAFVSTLNQARGQILQSPRHAQAARQHAKEYDAVACAGRALSIYNTLLETNRRAATQQLNTAPWLKTQRLLNAEWKLWENRFFSIQAALTHELPAVPQAQTGVSHRHS